jgi:hypothetical protein
MARYKMVALTNPVQGREQEFNDWYDKVHVPDLLKMLGVINAERYRIVGTHPWKYMAVYEFESEDPETFFAQIRSKANTSAMMMSESLELTSVVGMAVQRIPL